MSVTLKVENIPTEKLTFHNMSGPNTCRSYPDSYPQLRFPNGESVKISSGVIDPSIGGYQAQYKFSSVPVNAAEAILFIPCIHGAVSPGILPENWEVSMRFGSAPPELALTVIPVTVVPTMQATPEPALVTATVLRPEPASDKTDHLSVLKVIDTGKDYIIIGTFTRPAPRPNEKGIYALVDIISRDSNQQVIERSHAPLILASASGGLRASLASPCPDTVPRRPAPVVEARYNPGPG